MYKLSITSSITRQSDGACIPNDPQNADYAQYLVWVASGNTPTPADIPNPNIAILALIDAQERFYMLPRHWRDFALKDMESKFTPEQLAGNPGYVKVKAFDGQMTALRASLK